jgi:hypothetical protein
MATAYQRKADTSSEAPVSETISHISHTLGLFGFCGNRIVFIDIFV